MEVITGGSYLRFTAHTHISAIKNLTNTAFGCMLSMLVLACIIATLQMPHVFADCQHGGNIPDPRYIGCFQTHASGQQGANLPNYGYTSTSPNFSANNCVSCCLSLNTNTEYYAGISQLAGAHTYKCTCGDKSEVDNNFVIWNGCGTCPGNVNQSCGHGSLISIYEAFASPQSTTDGTAGLFSSEFTSERSYSTHRTTNDVIAQSSTISVSTGYTAGMTSEEKTTKMPINMGETQTKVDIGIIAGAAVGGGAVLIVAGIIIIVCIRRTRGNKSNDQRTSLSFPNSTSNPSFQSPPLQLEDLYTKPNKKKKNQPPSTPTPDDPSYQDVLPSGAQHQYANVKDDPHPYTAVREEPNLYDSIQDDPQYATVQKGRKQAPNVETNPLYGRGSVDNTAYDSVGPLSNDSDRAPSVCEMTDNIIYE